MIVLGDVGRIEEWVGKRCLKKNELGSLLAPEKKVSNIIHIIYTTL